MICFCCCHFLKYDNSKRAISSMIGMITELPNYLYFWVRVVFSKKLKVSQTFSLKNVYAPACVRWWSKSSGCGNDRNNNGCIKEIIFLRLSYVHLSQVSTQSLYVKALMDIFVENELDDFCSVLVNNDVVYFLVALVHPTRLIQPIPINGIASKKPLSVSCPSLVFVHTESWGWK